MLSFVEDVNCTNFKFRTSKSFIEEISGLLQSGENHIRRIVIGFSEENRPIYGFIAGSGDTKVVLMGGAHSDEPVGPETLRLLVSHFLQHPGDLESLFDTYSFFIIPHINPDGELKNLEWIRSWPDLPSYAMNVFREEPGRDLEFGYPDMRIENKAVSRFLKKHAPYDLYINFHGMAFAEGVMLLIERHWIDRTRQLQLQFRSVANSMNLPLHDHDRGGEKGFQYIGPGFTTTPEGKAMREHFLEKGDEETASCFHQSSMEFIRSLGNDPLCLVTELPLFLIRSKKDIKSRPGVPAHYLAFKEKLPEIRMRADRGNVPEEILEEFDFKIIDPVTQARIQLQVIKAALMLI